MPAALGTLAGISLLPVVSAHETSSMRQRHPEPPRWIGAHDTYSSCSIHRAWVGHEVAHRHTTSLPVEALPADKAPIRYRRPQRERAGEGGLCDDATHVS